MKSFINYINEKEYEIYDKEYYNINKKKNVSNKLDYNDHQKDKEKYNEPNIDQICTDISTCFSSFLKKYEKEMADDYYTEQKRLGNVLKLSNFKKLFTDKNGEMSEYKPWTKWKFFIKAEKDNKIVNKYYIVISRFANKDYPFYQLEIIKSPFKIYKKYDGTEVESQEQKSETVYTITDDDNLEFNFIEIQPSLDFFDDILTKYTISDTSKKYIRRI